MIKRLNDYQFTADEIARFTCNDCSTNVIEQGDFCMLPDQIWKDQFYLTWNDNLCIACIERRLGRHLTFMDLGFSPSVKGYPMSDTIRARYLASGAMQSKPRKKRKAKA